LSADATVLVTRHQMLLRPQLGNATRDLQGAKTTPIGIVITK
jgi:hypothetical protein